MACNGWRGVVADQAGCPPTARRSTRLTWMCVTMVSGTPLSSASSASSLKSVVDGGVQVIDAIRQDGSGPARPGTDLSPRRMRSGPAADPSQGQPQACGAPRAHALDFLDQGIKEAVAAARTSAATDVHAAWPDPDRSAAAARGPGAGGRERPRSGGDSRRPAASRSHRADDRRARAGARWRPACAPARRQGSGCRRRA